MNRILGLLTALTAAAVLYAGTAGAQAPKNIVKIGVLDDFAGPYAINSGKGALEGARMAAEDVGGKVLGKPIEIIFADMQNKVDVGAGIAREWYDREDVGMITGLTNSAVALAVQKIAMEKNRLAIPTGAASAQLTGTGCTPNSAHWVYDTYALGKGTGTAVVKQGGDTWFFITVDYTFGQSLQKDATTFVEAAGGKVVGSVTHPLDQSDFSSYLLQAKASKAKVIAIASGGANLANVIKQAGEFGIVRGGQRLVALIINNTDAHGIGINNAQGLLFTYAYHPEMSPEAKAFSDRFRKRVGHPPTMIQAGTYSAVNHYLKAIKAAGTDEAKAVMSKMRELPINDFMTKNGKLRPDGRVVRDMYLLQIKSPQEAKDDWDLLKYVATIPGDTAFRPLNAGDCPFVK